MKRESRFVNIPMSLWENNQLSWMAKIVLMEIDSYPRTELGVNVRAGSIANALGITKKECDDALRELFDKEALQINLSEGNKLLYPLIYKPEYVFKNRPAVVEGQKPSQTNNIDYDDLVKQWADICPMLPAIQRMTPQRKHKVRSCLSNAALTYGDLIKCFRIVAVTPFLNGTGGFAAHFDWLIQKSQNLQKVYEGFYARSPAERSDYERIMNGESLAVKKKVNDVYR